MTRTYNAERTIGGQIVYDRDDNPLDKHLDVARLCTNGFDWGPDADDRAVLQLAIAILADRRTWTTAVEHYRDLAAYIQDGFGEQDEWELRSLEVSDAIEETDGTDRFDQYLPQPVDVDIEDVDLDEINKAQRYALYERYNIEKHSFKAEQKLRTVKREGPAALLDNEDAAAPTASLDEFDQEEQEETSDSAESAHSEQKAGGDRAGDSDGAGVDADADDTGSESSSDEEETSTSNADQPEAEAGAESSDAPDEEDPVLAADGAGPEEDLDGATPASKAPEPTAPGDTREDPEAEQSTNGEDDSEDPLPATPEHLLDGFRELSEEMADRVAETVETIPGLLAQTPTDLLAAEPIDRKIVTRLTGTIDWRTGTPIGEQNTPDLDVSWENTDDVDTGTGRSDEDENDGDGDGGSVGDNSGSSSDKDDGSSGESEADDSPETDNDETDQAETEDRTASSGSVWNPTEMGYSVAGSNGARIYRDYASPGDFEVYLQSDSGDLYQVGDGLSKSGADTMMNRLAAAIAPVDIERGAEEFAPELEDIPGASLVEAPGSDGGSSTDPVEEQQQEEAATDDPEDTPELMDDWGEKALNMPESVGPFDQSGVDVDACAGMIDYCYSDASDIPNVDEIVITIRLLSDTWEVYVGPDGETHPRGTFQTQEEAIEQARTIANRTIGSDHAANPANETGEVAGTPVDGNGDSTSVEDLEDPKEPEESQDEVGETDSEFSGEDVKAAFDVHGPPAFALADAFDSQDALVEAVADNADLTDIDGVGGTTAQQLRDNVLEDDEPEHDGDPVESDPSAEEFEWVGSEKPLVAA